MRIQLLLLSACYLLIANAQDCKVYGIRCTDHEQCCGGCCFNGVCIDTYRECTSDLDVCEGHSCIGEETCVTYNPPQCAGCEPIPVCTLL